MFAFPKNFRLLCPAHYRRVHSQGKHLAGELIYLDIAPNSRGVTRLGISISRKYGKSVLRNRFKRCLREAFRLHRSSLPLGFDLIVRPRSKKENITTELLTAELKNLLTAKP